jgi:hypothetical protein
MHPHFTHALADARREELLRLAERDRLAREPADANAPRRISLRVKLFHPRLAAKSRLAITGQ